MKEWFIISAGWKLHGSRPARFIPRCNCSWWIFCRNRKFRVCSEWWTGVWVSERRHWVGRVGQPVSDTVYYGRPSVKKKNSVAGADGARHIAAVESDILSTLQPLVEHCCITKYDDGDNRETGWITIKTQGAAWVVQVKDPDSGNSFSALGDTLDKALETAALMLACDQAPWQPDAFLKRGKPATKK